MSIALNPHPRLHYDVTDEDVTSGRHSEDDIFEYGLHGEAPRFNIAEGGSYGFPYRARNTVSCMAEGQAAALCAASGKTTRDLNYGALRRELVRNGVYLTEHN